MGVKKDEIPQSQDETSRWLVAQRIGIQTLGEFSPALDTFCKELLAPAEFVNKLHGKGLTLVELTRRFRASQLVIKAQLR